MISGRLRYIFALRSRNAQEVTVGRYIVDDQKCRRDGICVAVCPVGILGHSEAMPPSVNPGEEALCIGCGHCVAACPYGACSLDTMPTSSCPPVRPEWALGPERAEHFLRSRRSIRVYRAEEPAPGVVESLVRVAAHAPSGHNGQPVRWCVIAGREKVRAVSVHVVEWMRRIVRAKPVLARRMLLDRVVQAWELGSDRVCRGAPVLVAAHAPRADASGPVACTLALGYLELAAPAFGLGACWAGYVMMAAGHSGTLLEALGLPEGQQLGGAMMLGVPRYRYHRLPTRNEPHIDWR